MPLNSLTSVRTRVLTRHALNMGGQLGVPGVGAQDPRHGLGGPYTRKKFFRGQVQIHTYRPQYTKKFRPPFPPFKKKVPGSGFCLATLGVGLGWVGLGQGLAWSPTHGPRRLPCRTRLGGRTRVSGHKAYRTVDRPQTPRWRSRAGDAAVPVCMCPCVSEGGGEGCGTPACSIVVRRWRAWRGEVCAWCSRPGQGGWRA